MDSPHAPRPTTPQSAAADRLIWVGIACFVLLVAGAAWMAPKIVAQDQAQATAAMRRATLAPH